MQITKDELQSVAKLRAEMHTLRGAIANTHLMDFERKNAIKQLHINTTKCREIYDKVIKIPDPLIRAVIRAKYLDEKTWAEISRKIGNGITVSGVRMMVTRYLKDIK